MNQRVVQPVYHHEYLSNLAVVPFLTWSGVVRFPSLANYGCLCLLTSRLNKDVQLTKLYTAAQIWEPRSSGAVTRRSQFSRSCNPFSSRILLIKFVSNNTLEVLIISRAKAMYGGLLPFPSSENTDRNVQTDVKKVRRNLRRREKSRRLRRNRL